MFDLTGRVALVTGAGSSVGAGVATFLADQGASVAVNDLRSDRAAGIAAAIVGAGGRAAAVAFDVTDRIAVGAGVAAVAAAVGPVDILVNCAGSARPAAGAAMAFRDTDPEAWSDLLEVGLFGVLQCTQAVIDGMCEQGWGRVITISSASGTTGVGHGLSLDGAAKGGAISFMRNLSREVALCGVTVNTLALGHMDQAGPGTDTGMVEWLERDIPVGRAGNPQDVGAACVYLSSDEAGWLTGQTIGLNGGSFTS